MASSSSIPLRPAPLSPPRRAERNSVKILALIWPLFGRGLPEPFFCDWLDAWLADMLGRSEEGEGAKQSKEARDPQEGDFYRTFEGAWPIE